MATYIKGVTDVMPKLAPVQVDYKLLSTSLGALQNRYNKGFEQVRSMYNSLINSPVSSQDNEQFRRDFLKKADSAMSQLAGVDLSNAGNVQQAMNLFTPLTEDEQFSTDLYLTRSQNNEMAKLEQVRTSTDEKVRAQYSNIMREYLNIGKERLTEMRRDDGSISKARVHKFSPWTDVNEYASDLAKKQGLEIKIDYRDGLRKVTQVNGKDTIDTYANWFKNTIGNKFDEQFRIEAEVDLDRAVKGLISSNPQLTKETALQQIGQNFSTEYVRLYNDQLSDMQGQLDKYDAEKRKIMKKYPTKMPPEVYEKVMKMKEAKDVLADQLAKLTREKGDDGSFQQKAVELFLNNPAGTYVSQVRKRYQEAFAENQALGKQSTTYEADQVALQTYIQEKSQAHDFAKLAYSDKLQRARTADELALKFRYDVALKGVEKQQATGIGIGQATDVGQFDVGDLYRAQVVKYDQESMKAYTDPSVLAVAANITVDARGNIISKDPTFNMGVLSGAMANLGNNQPLNQAEKQQLSKFLGMVNPGVKYDVNKLRFVDVMPIVTKAVRQNKYINPELGKAAGQAIYNSNTARQAYADMYNRQSENLAALASNPAYAPYIRPGRFGGYTINYDAVNKLTGNDKELMYRSLMGTDYNAFKETAAMKRNTVTLSPSDPNKFDYTLHRVAFANAEEAGVTVNGVFKKLTPESKYFGLSEGPDPMALLRDIVVGGQNLKDVFDPSGTTYERKIINNREYVKVTIPVLKDSKGVSKATTMGFDPTGDIAANNKIELLVPIDKARNLAGPDMLVKNPVTGQQMITESPLKSVLQELTGESMLPEARSWVSRGLTSSTGIAPFPDYLRSMVADGSIYRDVNGRINAKFVEEDGSNMVVDLTRELNGVTYDDLLANPTKYDRIIRNQIETILQDYDVKMTTFHQNAVNNNKTKAATNQGWVDTKNISW